MNAIVEIIALGLLQSLTIVNTRLPLVVQCLRPRLQDTYFLPLFLIPPPPRGPLPPAFFAISSRAFLSAISSADRSLGRSGFCAILSHTSCLLELVSFILLVLLLVRLLGFLVVNWVGTR